MWLACIENTAVSSPHKHLYLVRLSTNRKTISLIIYTKTQIAALWKIHRNNIPFFGAEGSGFLTFRAVKESNLQINYIHAGMYILSL